VVGAWQFLLVTNADLYLPDSNFVFAVHFPVHGVVSFARLGEIGDRRRVERLSKQLVASAIKCFGVKQASRPDCVTAYVDSLGELDRRPIMPLPETRAEYRRRVERWEVDPSRDPERPR
jgi:predicted Zn-dependent protease